MKTTILATTLLIGLAATAGTANTAQAAPVSIAPANIVTLADVETGQNDLLHTVKGFKKGYRGHRRGRGFSRRGFNRRGSGHRGFRNRGFGHKGFGFNRFGHHGFGHSSYGHHDQYYDEHHGKSFSLFKFFGFKK